MKIEIEHGAIIADDEGLLWRVLEVTDDALLKQHKAQSGRGSTQSYSLVSE